MRDDHEAAPFDLDRKLLRRALERAALGYDKAAFLHREVGNRLLERLNLIKRQPETIVDVGCGTGAITAALMKKYRKARVIGLDLAPALVKKACKQAPWLRTLHGAVAEPEALPLPSASCDLVFSHFALPWCLDLDRVFAEFQRVLKPGGGLLFSTLGPDTLIELRRSWAAADGYNHINAFLDMHDIGDALMRARLAEPVMDVERLTLTYSNVGGLMRDLKALGAGNFTFGRARGLTGKGRLRAMQAAYELFRRPDGLLPVSCEVVYGHAWGSIQNRSRLRGDGAAVFPLEQLHRHGRENR
ncbi:malonyl-ACP O-methyltransferase BioC [Candidatus Contendibacter odensensis]|uniref:Malonyl-[acyl-carrier protein] O-methyltransferase n=1 Tax=Candidatus Contendobacter odensis Run_B_J11 TaxID=1400861 RepID=A0A7U7GB99_9GAMM|nr:malonyl-ACP O-methyltransferase BioC [Candidatus Contendobacter odensis]CDH44973.1 Malonyl-CoA O-methyltransferase BioC [Candidatus Contendobacter odensis Run_B_J11]